MLSFVVLVSRHGGPLDGREVDRIAAESMEQLPYEAAFHVRWTATGGRIAVLAWDLHPEGYPPGPAWFVDESGVTAFAGSVHPVGGRWGPGSWARQLSDRMADGCLATAHEAMWGIHTIVRLRADGRGFVSPDPISMGLVYRAATPAVEVVANRGDLAAIAVGTFHDRDPVGAGWLLVFEYLVDDDTSFRGVRTVSAGRAVEIEPDGRVSEVRIDGDTWIGPPGAYDEIFDALAADLEDHVTTVAALERRAEISLSGGRDSRLVLALALTAGAASSLRYMTAESFPNELDPDVHVAEMLAERLALDHRVIRMNYRTWSTAEFERRVLVHAHTTSGMLGAKNPRSRLALRPHIQVSGAFGENLTGSRSGDAPPASVDEAFEFMAAKMYGGPTGGFVRADAREHYRTAVRRRFDDLAADGTPPDELPYRFYVEYYLRGGVTREVEWAAISPNIEPLYSIHLPAAARAAGWLGRRHHRLHFDLFAAAAPDLAALPFANFAWPDELLAAIPDGDRFRTDPVMYSGQIRSTRGRRWEDHVEVYRRYLLDGPNHPIADLVDLAMVEGVLAGNRPMPPAGRLQLDNAVGVAAWLSGVEQRDPVMATEVATA